MIQSQNEKFVVALAPFTVSAATQSASTDAIDTLGWHNAQITFIGVKISASNLSNAFTVLKLQHATASNGTFSDFTNASWAATTNTTAAASEFLVASTSVTTLPFAVQWNIGGVLGTNGLSRWLRVAYTMPAANLTNACTAILSRGDQAPSSDAERSVWQSVRT